MPRIASVTILGRTICQVRIHAEPILIPACRSLPEGKDTPFLELNSSAMGMDAVWAAITMAHLVWGIVGLISHDTGLLGRTILIRFKSLTIPLEFLTSS